KSYTGEDVVEISCHGGLLVTKKVLRAIVKQGAFPAEAGEFTKRAFLNGKLTLTQAEAVSDLISAESELGFRAAQNAMQGALYQKIQHVLADMLTISGHISAYIDYPEEDLDTVTMQQIKQKCEDGMTALKELLNTFDRGKIIRDGIETVIVGKPNVGKSTLMNLLAGCQKSIVTEVPGTTRDIVEETIKLGDIVLRLSDTAGIRETTDIIEQAGVHLAYDRLKMATLILAVFDFSSPLSAEDLTVIEKVKGERCIAVINKSDLPTKINYKYIKDNFKHIVEISAKEQQGIEQLNLEITQLFSLNEIASSGAILANERQYHCAYRAMQLLQEVLDTIELGYTLDAVDVSIESVISALLELSGEKVTDAVVNEVFSHFCVGK
ncbi:MAG: tRNA uridine-5-carboxymethylaminomethyl(34) synthesis GTPase MnmE, partial [Oscillospiraceae bacterium]